MASFENYTIRIPKHLKKQLQILRLNYDVSVAQLFYALVKTAEKHKVDFEHYLWESRRMR